MNTTARYFHHSRTRLLGFVLTLAALTSLTAEQPGVVGNRLQLVHRPFTESVEQMIVRDQQRASNETAAPIVIDEPLRELTGDFAPGAPAAQTLEPTPIEEPPLAPQTVGTSFVAISLQDQFNAFGTGSIPPDIMGAVGPNHFIEAINTSVAIYNKTTGALLSHVSLTNFFTVTVGPTTYPRNGCFDPRICFDKRSGRFFATTMERGAVSGQQNGIVLAVSRTSDPTGTWDKYFLDVGDPINGTTTYFTDYSTLGTDDNGVYIGARMFPSTGSSVAKIIATSKASLLAGSPSLSTVFQFNNISDMYSTPQPALNFDATAANGPAFFVSSSSSFFANVNYRSLTWSGGTPALSSTSVLSTSAFAATLNAPASGSTTAINTGDQRLQMAVIRSGGLWTARTIGVNSTGGSTSADRTACEWFRFGISGSTLAASQTGRVFDTAASNPRFYFYPSIVVSGQGHASMGFSGVASTEFVGAYFTGRLASDAANTMGSVALLKAGGASYTQLDGSGRNRWGDYSYTSLDPNDDMTMWTIQEYATSSANIWGTWVSQILAPPPATPSAASTTVTQGASNVNIVITGTSSSGSGFYDPGAGFTNRIAASVGGTGVTVNSVTFTSATQITLNVSASAGATLGARTVTVTNPDGQIATSSTGIFTIVAPPTVTSLNRVNTTPSNAATVNWTLTFSSAVTGVSASNFSLSGTATGGASVGAPTTGDGGVNWNVPVTTGADGTLTLSLANSTGQSPTVSTSLPFAGQSYVIDKTTLSPSLSAPANNSTFTGIVSVSFSLPETALAASVKLIFAGSNSRTLTLAGTQETSGAHSFTFASASPTGAAQVASITGGSSVPDGTYSVTLSYQDALGNAAATVVSTNVNIDTVTLAPALTAPATNAAVSNPIAVSFSLPEAALSFSVKLIFSGGTSRTLTLAASQETSGAHGFSFNPASPTGAPQVLSISGGTSIPDGVYTVTLSYQDALANPASTAISTNVTIDTATQTPTLTQPATSSLFANPVSVSFSLPEPAFVNTVKLIFTGPASRTLNLAGSQETSGAHSFTFNPANPMATAAISSVTGGTSVPEGLYTVTLSYQDVLGNAAATAGSTNVRIDTTPPTLNLPAPIVVTATSPSGALVSYSASASDPGGSGIASSNFNPPSGSTFPIGTTNVSTTATDNAGNVANGGFTVTVNPNPPPTGGTFTSTPNTGVHQGDPLSLTAAGWTDPDLPLTYQFFLGVTPLNSPGVSSTLGISAPAPGSYTLKVRVTDTAGSFTDATQSLTVVAFTPIESWRQANFGDYHNTGLRADDADFDNDGEKNLLEFGLGTDPTHAFAGPPSLIYTGTFASGGTVTRTGQPIERSEGTDVRALFDRRADYAAAGLTYTVEFTANAVDWVASGTSPTVLADNGTIQIVSVPYPAFVLGNQTRYFRVRVDIGP